MTLQPAGILSIPYHIPCQQSFGLTLLVVLSFRRSMTYSASASPCHCARCCSLASCSTFLVSAPGSLYLPYCYLETLLFSTRSSCFFASDGSKPYTELRLSLSVLVSDDRKVSASDCSSATSTAPSDSFSIGEHL